MPTTKLKRELRYWVAGELARQFEKAEALELSESEGVSIGTNTDVQLTFTAQ